MTASFRIRVFMCIIDSLDPVFLGPFECPPVGSHLRLFCACLTSPYRGTRLEHAISFREKGSSRDFKMRNLLVANMPPTLPRSGDSITHLGSIPGYPLP